MEMSSRAYSLLTVKSVEEEQRIIRGTATSPEADRLGDIVDPLGVIFKNPLPLLHQHDSKLPVGMVTFDKPTEKGIEFEARLPRIEEPPSLKDRVDSAWNEIKSGLLRGVSIGFRPLEHAPLNAKDPYGPRRFLKSEVLELSLVSVPAHPAAQISLIRSIDSAALAAFGREPADRESKQFDTGMPAALGQTPADEEPAPGASGQIPQPLNAKRIIKMDAQTPIAEQISAFEASRAAKHARLMNLIAEQAGTTLNAEQSEEYDTIRNEVDEIDKHLVRLGEIERLNKAAAKPVNLQPINGGAQQVAIRPPSRIEVRGNNLPKGTAFTRYAIALARGKGDLSIAANQARAEKSWHDTPEVETVLKAAVAAGTTTDATWAGPLVEYQAMASEFVELLYAQTIIGRIPGLRRVPFNIKVPRQTAGASAGWVGQGAPKPLSKLAFDTISLGAFKAAVIVVMTEELVRFSNPSAEALVRADLIAAITAFLDSEFLDPAQAAVANVAPASITNGVTPTAASGTTSDALRIDLNTLMASFITANKSMAGAVWVMTPTDAMKISQMQNALGQPVFPTVTGPEGGTLMGIPLVTSTNIVPGATGTRIFLINAPDILVADGGIMLDISREASLQMDSAPDNPALATTVLVSLWQHNLVGIRAERMINWLPRRTGSVKWIENAAYVLS